MNYMQYLLTLISLWTYTQIGYTKIEAAEEEVSTEREATQEESDELKLRLLILETLTEELIRDLQEIKERKAHLIYVDIEKIRNTVLAKEIKEKENLELEYSRKENDLIFQRDTLISAVDPQNIQDLQIEFSNKTKQINALRIESQEKLKELQEENDQLLRTCLKQAIYKYAQVHEDEIRGGIALISSSSVIYHMQSQEPQSVIISLDCTDELLAYASSAYLNIKSINA